LASNHPRRRGALAQIASTAPKGQAPCAKQYNDAAAQAPANANWSVAESPLNRIQHVREQSTVAMEVFVDAVA
jgi:hypothetical protein